MPILSRRRNSNISDFLRPVDDVAFAASAACRGEVESLGFAFFAAGLDYHMSDPGYPQSLCGPAGLVFRA